MSPELELLESVNAEIHRIVVKGEGPRVFAFNPDPENKCPVEVDLAVNAGETEGVRHIVRLGSFQLVPGLLERLKHIVPMPWNFRMAPFLYAIQEFSSDMKMDIWEEFGQDAATVEESPVDN